MTSSAFAQLLRDTMARVLDLDEALAAYDTFAASIATGHHSALFLQTARPHVYTCLDRELRANLRRLGGPELGTGVIERIMRELNARTDIGGSRWSIPGLRDLINLLLARITDHPAWTALWQSTHPLNSIPSI